MPSRPGSETAPRPPNAPWWELASRAPAEGTLSVYLTDTLSPLPVRGITLPGNNKSDPNIETRTFGLFSTCERAMRVGIVRDGRPYIFFITNQGDGRILTGYYRIGWYAPAVGAAASDFALAADDARFIWPAIALATLPLRIRRVVGVPFRLTKRVDAEITRELLQLIRRRPDRTKSYLQEIDRLERFNFFRTGFRYVAWRQKEAFSWALAGRYLIPTGPASATGALRGNRTTSRSDRWKCGACGQVVENRALLRRCPWCGEIGSLREVPSRGSKR